MPREHRYDALVEWTGNLGAGTADYDGYGRQHRVRVAGKPPLSLSADPAFRGAAGAHNPEELLVAAVAGCHLLTYLALCARRGVRVDAYTDDALGIMTVGAGGSAMREIVLRPTVTVADPAHAPLAAALHEAAHATCPVARACAVPVRVAPTVRVAPCAPHPSLAEPAMQDVTIALDDRPGALADMGEALGGAGVSVEGGGAWVVDGRGVAHVLVPDGAAARRALDGAGIRVLAVRDVVVQRLRQDVPGQLGALTRRMADARVNIEALYSDHDHRLVLVVDDEHAARAVASAWARERA